jgi:hypothetical protein
MFFLDATHLHSQCLYLVQVFGYYHDSFVTSAAPAVLGQTASHVVRPSRGTVYLGQHQQQSDQVLLCDLTDGPLVRCESRGNHHLSAKTRAILHAED